MSGNYRPRRQRWVEPPPPPPLPKPPYTYTQAVEAARALGWPRITLRGFLRFEGEVAWRDTLRRHGWKPSFFGAFQSALNL